MKNKKWRCIIFLLSLLIGLSGCRNDSVQKKKFRVGVAYSTAGKRDNSYSQSASFGVDVARQTWKFDLNEVEPSQLSDLEPSLAALSRAGCDLVIAVSFYYVDPIKQVARQFPNTKYLIIDGEVRDLPNVRSLMFREEQGSYLVGAIAGLKSSKRNIGAVIAMDIPILNKFGAGYQCGARAVGIDPKSIQILYVGAGPDSFNDPLKGAEVARVEITRGSDVIYQVAAASGTGVISAAKDAGIFAIGVDSDQASLAPGTVLTSMLKRVDLAVEDSIEEVINGHFVPGLVYRGLQPSGHDYVDYVYNESNQRLITPDIRQKVEALRANIKTGRLIVPQKLGDPCPVP